MQAYLDTIKAKTGWEVSDFKREAAARGLGSYKVMMVWLKGEVGLGHGHANLIAQLVTKADEIFAPQSDKLDALFAGNKSHWRSVYDGLAAEIGAFGPDVSLTANRTYVNLERGGKKFGLIQPSTAARLDIGLKLKGQDAEGALELAGSWNAMVTHRIQLSRDTAMPAGTMDWLRKAYNG